jgi:hypothetical protein
MKARITLLVDSPEPIRNKREAEFFIRHLEKHACNAGEALTL